MFGMSKTPNYWRPDSADAVYTSGPRSALGAVMGSEANVYQGEGLLTSARTAFGFFPDTPAYLAPPPPLPCPEPEVETEDEEACDCIAEGEPHPDEGSGSDDEGQPKCGPVTIVIKRKDKK